MENIHGLDHYIEERGREWSSAFPCPECDGRGYVYSDPDGKQLVCQYCDGWYGEAERAAQAEERADEERGA